MSDGPLRFRVMLSTICRGSCVVETSRTRRRWTDLSSNDQHQATYLLVRRGHFEPLALRVRGDVALGRDASPGGGSRRRNDDGRDERESHLERSTKSLL